MTHNEKIKLLLETYFAELKQGYEYSFANPDEIAEREGYTKGEIIKEVGIFSDNEEYVYITVLEDNEQHITCSIPLSALTTNYDELSDYVQTSINEALEVGANFINTLVREEDDEDDE